MDIEFKVTTIQIADNSENWVDPVVGLRSMPQTTDNWHIILKGDIGGFGIVSDYIWNLHGSVAWDVAEWLNIACSPLTTAQELRVPPTDRIRHSNSRTNVWYCVQTITRFTEDKL